MNITNEQNGVMAKASKRQLRKIKRRRATECKLVRPSNSNPGYFKYNVTIQEKDGSKHTEPCYGIDMQDAISRLIWKERTIKVEKRMSAGWIFILWLALMVWPAIVLTETNQPIFILYMFGGIFTIVALGSIWDNYVNKK